MVYFVYDKDGEFIDVFNFDSKELAMYKMSNPLHSVELEKEVDQHFLIEDDGIDENAMEEVIRDLY